MNWINPLYIRITKHFTSQISYCVTIYQHVCFLQKLKTNYPEHMSAKMLRASAPWLLPPTDITGGEPVRRYTIPSSTIVLPETEHRTNSPDIRKGRTNPTPNLIDYGGPTQGDYPEKTTKLENGTPPHHRPENFVPPPLGIIDMKHKSKW